MAAPDITCDQVEGKPLGLFIGECYGTDVSTEKCSIYCFERDKCSLKILWGVILLEVWLQFETYTPFKRVLFIFSAGIKSLRSNTA
jgi:hypothetical protein